jgi:hypothetical protein
MTTPRDALYAGYRYAAELIGYAVWLYFRFPLSLRMVEEMLAALFDRGTDGRIGAHTLIRSTSSRLISSRRRS